VSGRCRPRPGRWAAGLLGLAALALVAGGPPARAANAPLFVVVQYANARSLRVEASPPPTLEEAGIRSVAVPPGEPVEQFLERLRTDPAVMSAQPDARVTAADIPDDAFYGREQSNYLGPLNAPNAWDLATGSSEVVIAVLDSGVDLNHEEFAGRSWTNPGDVPGNGVDDDNNACVDDAHGCRFIDFTQDQADNCGYTNRTPTGDVLDDNGRPGQAQHSHGTLVAGVAAATGNNRRGVAGIDWNARVMSVKVLDCGTPRNAGNPTGKMFDVARGIQYAVQMGADIINLSLASAPTDPVADSPALRNAIEQALARGVLIVAAAGNNGAGPNPSPGYPAAYTQYANVVAVGASNNDEANTWYSRSAYGPAIDLAAPGVGITGPTRSDLGPSIYGSENGTSFSAPLVAGMFALMKARNSALPMEQYLQIAREAAKPAPGGPPNWAGSGIVDIGGALGRVPMTLNGAALHDWKDVDVGVEVKAMVGPVECGTTVTSRPQPPFTSYAITVRADAQKAGCGAPGRAVQIMIAGQPAVPTVPWGGRDVDLALRNVDVSTVSPPPGPVVIQRLGSGWNNIGHLDAAGQLPAALSYLPSAWTAALKWDPAGPGLDGPGRYLRTGPSLPAFARNWLSIERYDAYWVDGSGTSVAMANPGPGPRAVLLQPGWNNFVYTGTSKSVADALAGVAGLYTEVLQYDNPAGAWRIYIPGQPRSLNDFGGMMTLQTYWVFATGEATLQME
jgi:subtilisin family serine protease